MPLLIKIAVSAVAGAFAASATMFGLVYSQTSAPDVNPASEPVLSYGDQ